MYRIAENHHIILLPWMTVLSHPEIVSLGALFPEDPERPEQLRKLLDLGAIVAIPEAEGSARRLPGGEATPGQVGAELLDGGRLRVE